MNSQLQEGQTLNKTKKHGRDREAYTQCYRRDDEEVMRRWNEEWVGAATPLTEPSAQFSFGRKHKVVMGLDYIRVPRRKVAVCPKAGCSYDIRKFSTDQSLFEVIDIEAVAQWLSVKVTEFNSDHEGYAGCNFSPRALRISQAAGYGRCYRKGKTQPVPARSRTRDHRFENGLRYRRATTVHGFVRFVSCPTCAYCFKASHADIKKKDLLMARLVADLASILDRSESNSHGELWLTSPHQASDLLS
ncbi:hypothetical protein EVAR_99591_1 [Eumeta japonica]|uniref:Uncharacterized protein n=1 Tax=Eumeta variegata TaxID=151549 RepID=A0A4C1ZGI0_EUMVA|nr:hypothetical protein EVAR_99591_1 [Eumeta japonica]